MPKLKSKDPEQDNALVQRVEALEREVAELKKLVISQPNDGRQPFKHDWQRTFGIFKDDPTYNEAIRLGQAWRKRQPKC